MNKPLITSDEGAQGAERRTAHRPTGDTYAGGELGHARQDRVITLHDGRMLGYAEYGPSDGSPLLFFHGTPGARNVLSPNDPLLHAHNIRIIAPERPGYGLSSPDPHRTLLSWANDVRELTNHLGAPHFAVAGASGGGPYALACAYAMPDRVTSAGLICSSAPFHGRSDLTRLTPFNKLKFGLPRYLAGIVRIDIAVAAPLLRRWPQAAARRVVQLSATDKAVVAGPDRETRIAALLYEAFRHGGQGLYTDLVLGSRPWGFALPEIQVPVRCWHGSEDQMAPLWMLERAVSAIPSAELSVIRNAGHLLLQHPEVWPALLQSIVRHA